MKTICCPCENCGEDVEFVPTQENHCPHCGALLSAEEAYFSYFENHAFPSSVFFGSYPQGKGDPEPIEWIFVKEDSGVFLLSKKVLDAAPFNGMPVPWKDSSLRDFLTKEFLNRVFHKDEQSLLLPVDVEGDLVSALDAGDLPHLEHRDKLAEPTLYAEGKGLSGHSTPFVSWWVKDIGNQGNVVMGGINTESDGHLSDCFPSPASMEGVRPAIRLSYAAFLSLL